MNGQTGDMERESWLVTLLGIGYQVSDTRVRTSVCINEMESKHTGGWRRRRGRRT